MLVVIALLVTAVAVEAAIIIWLLLTILHILKEIEHHKHPHPHPTCL